MNESSGKGHIQIRHWIIAILGLLVLGSAVAGFQAGADKFGVVDMQRVIDQSEQGKATQARLNNMLNSRKSLLEFIGTHRVLTAEQAVRLHELSLKEAPTEAEKTEMTKIKNDVKTSGEKFQALQTKQNPTAEDRTLLSEYMQRANTMMQTVDRWANEFDAEMQKVLGEQNTAITEKARAAVQEVGKAQGYTLVFEAKIAPYGANDITDPAIKAMNAKK